MKATLFTWLHSKPGKTTKLFTCIVFHVATLETRNTRLKRTFSSENKKDRPQLWPLPMHNTAADLSFISSQSLFIPPDHTMAVSHCVRRRVPWERICNNLIQRSLSGDVPLCRAARMPGRASERVKDAIGPVPVNSFAT